jgi:hypothetical protein
MKRMQAFSLLLAALVVAGSSLAQPADLAGSWSGAIELPGAELGVVVVLESADGSWSGSIDIPAQGLSGFALSDVRVGDGGVHFAMAGIPGEPTFDGALSATGDAISGTFTQGPQSFPFTLHRTPAEGEAEGEPAEGDAAEAEPAEDAAPAPPAVPGEGPVGDWMGTLDVGQVKLRLALHVEAAADGTLSAVLHSIDQSAQIAVDSLAVEGRSWRLTAGSIGGTFTGTMNADGSAVDGTWSQGGQSRPLRLARLAEPFALARPQNPQPPFPYESREVAFRHEAAGIRLAGTLVVPPGDGPFPAVVLVTGSGPQDRDETLFGHKPFLVLADHLARRGVASLRYDDRGFGASEGDHMGSTVADFAADAAAALAFLAAQPKIDRDALGILGHSEGGLAAPRVAASNAEVDFLVLLAPPGEPLDALVLRQERDALRQRGAEDALIERAMARQAASLALLADASLGTDEVKERLLAQAADRDEVFSPAELALLGDEEAVEAGIALGATAWFRSLLREDPVVHLKAVRVPVLALFGENDVQVAAEVNAPLVERALAAAGNEDYEVRVLPGLNHLFQHSASGAVAEYGTINETFSPQALDVVGDWLEERFASERAAAGGI